MRTAGRMLPERQESIFWRSASWGLCRVRVQDGAHSYPYLALRQRATNYSTDTLAGQDFGAAWSPCQALQIMRN